MRTALRAVCGATAALLAICPLTVAVGVAVEPLLYGRFEYATAAEVQGARYPLPSGATEVVLDTTSAGHSAAFTVGEKDLRDWLERLRAERPNLPHTPLVGGRAHVTLAPNGAGFDLWHDVGARRAGYRMAYW